MKLSKNLQWQQCGYSNNAAASGEITRFTGRTVEVVPLVLLKNKTLLFMQI